MHASRSLAVFSLAAGMALAIALSSIADSAIFRPLPVGRPDEIVRIFSVSPLHSLGFVSYSDYRDFARNTRTLAGVAAQTQVLLGFSAAPTSQGSEMRMGLAVSANYFDTLNVTIPLGRSFQASEERQGVVILSDAFWRRQFQADRSIVGRTIFLAHAPFTVIGVAPPHFGLDRFLHEDFYLPIGVYAAGLLPANGRPWEDRGRRYFSIYARRTAPMAAVRANLTAVSAQLSREFPLTNRQVTAMAMTDLDARMAASGSLRVAAWILLALAMLSIVSAASNVTGLLLLRGEARSGEYALKVALGATPLRLFTDALSESGLLSALAMCAAVPLAWAALKAAGRLWEMPTDLPASLDARLDARTAAMAGMAVLTTTLVCAIIPAIEARRRSLRLTSLRYQGPSHVRSALMAMQGALATAVLGCGAYLLAGMTSASHADLGYRTDHILTVTFDPSQSGSDETRARAFYRGLLDDTVQLPGVRAVAMAQSIPLGFTAAQKRVRIAVAGPDSIAVWMNIVTPGYFDLMRMRLVCGRDFDGHDTDLAMPVAVINEALAAYWPDGRALGGTMEIDGRQTEVVGVTRTAKYQQIGEAPRPFLYLAYEQNFVPRLTLHVLTWGAPASIAPAVVAAGRAVDPAQAASEIRPFEQFLSQGALFTARIGVTVTAAAGAVAWALSLTGLYACTASTIRRQEREIAVRQALGAQRGWLVWQLMTESAKPIALGTLAGLLAATGAQHLMDQMIYHGGVATWPSLAGAGVTVALGALAAVFLPAWRAASKEPAIALRGFR